jgi:hypothetical protein
MILSLRVATIDALNEFEATIAVGFLCRISGPHDYCIQYDPQGKQLIRSGRSHVRHTIAASAIIRSREYKAGGHIQGYRDVVSGLTSGAAKE